MKGNQMTASGTRLEENEPGKYYVTDACDGCGLCFSKALQNFMYSNDSSYYYIYQQPADEREEADIVEAISVCPQDCIKSDGVPS
jgi:ferredoxin